MRALIESGNLLQASQPKICLPLINRLYLKISKGIQVPDIKVVNGIICDGHHRYIASRLADVPLGHAAGVSSHPDITSWEAVSIDEDEWDTPETIQKYMEEDAEYNSLTYKELVELLNNS
ncbi:hypothetical protein FLA_2239 [Filimonas lacunae]|nr:hypothetical protein FLA_2239 [Filimonas lacunae]